jgi:3-demethoxyubiquinol 3-hydroxylase
VTLSLDRFIAEFDRGLRALTGGVSATRPCPSVEASPALSPFEQTQAAALMRVNHAGEICAQALYSAQKLTARSEQLQMAFAQAAREEEDHLAWTAQRLYLLDARTSRLNPLWYTGAFAIGCVVGALGERISLGFMHETERQVTQHLDRHLQKWPTQDVASKAIIAQMRTDESMHADAAWSAGGIKLIRPVRIMMRIAARIMTQTAYYL